MKTNRFEIYRIKLRNDLAAIASKLGKHVKLHGRQYIAVAAGTCMIMAFTAALVGCSSSGSKPKYTAEQWEKMKRKSRSMGSR